MLEENGLRSDLFTGWLCGRGIVSSVARSGLADYVEQELCPVSNRQPSEPGDWLIMLNGGIVSSVARWLADYVEEGIVSSVARWLADYLNMEQCPV